MIFIVFTLVLWIELEGKSRKLYPRQIKTKFGSLWSATSSWTDMAEMLLLIPRCKFYKLEISQYRTPEDQRRVWDDWTRIRLYSNVFFNACQANAKFLLWAKFLLVASPFFVPSDKTSQCHLTVLLISMAEKRSHNVGHGKKSPNHQSHTVLSWNYAWYWKHSLENTN